MQSHQKRRCAYLLIACLAWAVSAFAQRSETVEIPKTSPASIRIIRVSPMPREAVSKQTIIEVELAYKVERFEKKRFQPGATAAQNRPGYAWTVGETGNGHTALEEAAGQITARFALASIWDKDDVKVPLGIFRLRDVDMKRDVASTALLVTLGPYTAEAVGAPASIQITVDTYGHLIPGANRAAVDRLDDDASQPNATTAIR